MSHIQIVGAAMDMRSGRRTKAKCGDDPGAVWPDTLINPTSEVDAFWELAHQPRGAQVFEIDTRPYKET